MPRLHRGIGRDTQQWKRLVIEYRHIGAALGLPCWLCGNPIHYGLPPNHRWSYTLDHVIPLDVAPWLAEDRGNVRPAHRACNSRKGNKINSAPSLNTSRNW